ncbi:MAG TPA: AMP-binding protein [Terracidiphilus sp.]|jgi:long-chain acyl-CoA synthetase
MRDNLATLVEDFRRYGREIAVVRYQGNRRRVSTYGDIARLAGRFAAFLAQENIGPGDRVVLWAENSAEWIAAFHGCLLRGVLVVPLDAYGSAAFAARVAADVQPKLAVGDHQLIRQLPADDPRLAFSRVPLEEWPTVLPTDEAGPVLGINRDTPLQILFTSGTTGDPKGIVHTHGNVLASVGPIEQGAQRYLRYEKYVHPLRFLHTLPLSHVFGQTMGLWIPPILRAEVHFESRLVAPRLIETIHRERISVLAAVPRVFALLKTHLESSRPGLADQLAASRGIRAWKRWWRFRGVHHAFGFKFWALISGGGALPAAVEQFWNALGFVVVQGYGMTETTALITLNHPFHVARGTIGKPLPGREVKLGPDGEVLVRGPMISTATWSGGTLVQRENEWLSTGDLAATQATGELRFLGRKSEIIVTGTGVNIHPEDLEAVLEDQPGVAACAVVAIDTPSGPEPCAVLAMRGSANQAGPAIEAANARLADFQRVRRWMIWPEPDLPRTSTGKVRRKAVSAWLTEKQSAHNGARPASGAGVSSDWLLSLIAQITGETPPGSHDQLRLDEDLHLDSLGRVQLAAAIEEKLGIPPESGLLEQVQTLGQLRQLVSGNAPATAAVNLDSRESESLTPRVPTESGRALPAAEGSKTEGGGEANPRTMPAEAVGALAPEERVSPIPPQNRPAALSVPEASQPIYPHWPWLKPVQWLRSIFIEAIMRPLVWLLANPRIAAPPDLTAGEPLLLIANHVTTYDGPLVQYALPGPMRRHLAAAMSGEMLDDFRHFRSPAHRRFSPFGPAAYYLLTALFNVFPLPRLRDFQRSFAHAGEALDRGFHVLVFPEGTRSAAGELARFRPGIGLLVKQSNTAVLPVAIRGLGELKARGRGWLRSGTLEIRVGTPIRFAPDATESAITERLHAEIEKLLKA